jgi:hypothetical protein
MTFAGAASATEIISVAGSGVVTSRLFPKTNGATASRKGCRGAAEPCPIVSRRDVVQCLSCLHRKVPEQFLANQARQGTRSAMNLREHGPIRGLISDLFCFSVGGARWPIPLWCL